MMFTNKQELVNAMRRQITSNDEQAIKAMLKIYEYQTEEEKVNYNVIEYNGVGFTGSDAQLLTSFCKQYQTKNYLSPRQISIIRDKIGKYAAQLVNQAIKRGLYIKEHNCWVVA